MKKLFCLGILAIMICSCCPNDGGYEHVSTTNLPIPCGYVDHFEYRGHKYIKFGEQRGVVHDPDCPCHTKTTDNNSLLGW